MEQISTRVLQSCTFPWVALLNVQFQCELSYHCKWQGMANILTFFVGYIFCYFNDLHWLSKKSANKAWDKSNKAGVEGERAGIQHRRDFPGFQWDLGLGHNIPLMLVRSHTQAYTPSSHRTPHSRGSFCCVLALLFPLTTYIIFPSFFCSLLCLFPCFHREQVDFISVQS